MIVDFWGLSFAIVEKGPLWENKRRNDSRKVTATPSRQMPHTRGGGNWAGRCAPSPARLIWVERAPGGGVHRAGARVPREPRASGLGAVKTWKRHELWGTG